MPERPEWSPTVAQVAARIMARTRMPNGNIGAFNTETTPTATQVQEQIDLAVALMKPRLGEIFDVPFAQTLAALRTAYMVELAYFPEQSETGVSPYKPLRLEYEDALKNWDKAAEGRIPNDPGRMASLQVGTVYPGYSIYPTR